MKKLLTVEFGLEPGDQRLIFQGKEREHGEYLDMSEIKDQSKVILVEDPSSRERRIIKMRRNAKIQTVHRQINNIATEVDKLTGQAEAPSSFVFFFSSRPKLFLTLNSAAFPTFSILYITLLAIANLIFSSFFLCSNNGAKSNPSDNEIIRNAFSVSFSFSSSDSIPL